MSRGRRCCCCNDIYFYNQDGRNNQFKITPGDTKPTIKYFLSSFHFFVIDYHNKITLMAKLRSSKTRLCKTANLQWKDTPVEFATALGSGFGFVNNLACDHIQKRLFYTNLDTTNPSYHQLCLINYDGTNNIQIAIVPTVPNPPFSAVYPNILQNSLSYDHVTDKLYYIVYYTLTPAPSPYNQVYHIEYKSIKTDGTNHITECTLISYTQTGSIPVPATYGSHYLRVEDKVVVGLSDNSGNSFISTFLLTDGTRTDLLTNPVSSPYYRFISPRYCHRDSRIYYLKQQMIPALPNPSAGATYSSCKLDGTDIQTIFSFFSPVNEFNWSSFSNSLFRPGCGFEITGPTFNGVN